MFYNDNKILIFIVTFQHQQCINFFLKKSSKNISLETLVLKQKYAHFLTFNNKIDLEA